MRKPGKKTILLVSVLQLIASLAVGLAFGIGNESNDVLLSLLLAVGFPSSLILWVGLCYAVDLDTKKRGKSSLFSFLPFLIGGIGGLIYSFIILKEKD